MTHLGDSLSIRFRRSENTIDIDEAIEHRQRAVSLLPDGHPDKSRQLIGLANCLMIRFTHIITSEDAESAFIHFAAAANSSAGPPRTRFKAAKQWSDFASIVNHSSLLDAYECILGLMPLVAWLGLPISDRHQHLMEMGEITRDAAAAAISLERYDKALEWLEQGRSIVWTQILQLRTPADQLRDCSPKLADRLLHVSRLLDRGAEKASLLDGSSVSEEEEARKYRASTAEWEELVEQVRSISGFEDFLKPPRLSRLLTAANDGPVVVLNIAKLRCDALALLPGLDDIIHIPLPNVTSEEVTGLQRRSIRVTMKGGGGSLPSSGIN